MHEFVFKKCVKINYASEDDFVRLCAEIEHKIPELRFVRLFDDPLGDFTKQEYTLNGKLVDVYFDWQYEELWVRSDVDLSEFF